MSNQDFPNWKERSYIEKERIDCRLDSHAHIRIELIDHPLLGEFISIFLVIGENTRFLFSSSSWEKTYWYLRACLDGIEIALTMMEKTSEHA